ncbi:hypothetical protein DFQ26_003102 [Actinomortierella ambigua]|nr:hypothetical protein DFQ26_003102 [Actinomortierella ambigua]
MSKTHLYRFTHNKTEELDASRQDDVVLPHPPPVNVSLPMLCGFSAILFMNEFDRMGAQNIDVAQTCNMSEWQRRLFAGKSHAEHTQDSQGEPIDIASLPAKHPARSGLIYATTTTAGDNNESFTAFLFVIHKHSLSKPPKAVTTTTSSSSTVDISAESQQRVDALGVTHIWLCGSAPELRRQHLMSDLLARVERDVAAWKAQGQASGVISVHTIPQHFPGMVQFLGRQGFQGGLRYEGGDGKVVYWKEV